MPDESLADRLERARKRFLAPDSAAELASAYVEELLQLNLNGELERLLRALDVGVPFTVGAVLTAYRALLEAAR